MFSKKSAACFGKRSIVRSLQNPISTLAKDDIEAMHDNTTLERLAETKANESREKMLYDESILRAQEAKLKYDKEYAEHLKKVEEEKAKKHAEEEAKKAQPIPMDFATVPDSHFLEKPIAIEERKPPESVQLSMPLGEKKVYYTQILTKPQ